MPKRYLLTGGTGYIGSHTAVELLAAGHDVVIFDNLSNSSPVVLDRIRRLAGAAAGTVELVEGDVRDEMGLEELFATNELDGVVHFAGLKAVGESVAKPLDYYENNVVGSINLLRVMQRHDVRDLVFSSSATVYGDPDAVPLREDAPLRTTNPYGQTKLVIEEILRDLAASEEGWRIAILRYFNPVGAHESGDIGEDPSGIPNNLMPFVMQVAIGRHPQVKVFGSDYETPDGTAIRDYIHVVDLALGHLAALEHIDRIEGAQAINLGNGRGESVLDVIRAASAAVGKDIPYAMAERRPGDVVENWADCSLAKELLDWEGTRTLAQMCEDSWRWQSKNPNGYAS